MNAKQFKQLIREEISSELKRVLPVILDEYFCNMYTSKDENKSKSSVKEETVKKSSLKEMMDDDSVEETKPKKEYKTYVKNKVLNDVLNETIVKIPKGENSYVSSEMPDVESSGIDSITKDNSPIADVMNKDYSKLMKAVDEKVKVSRG